MVALEHPLDLIRSNMGVVVKKKFKIKNRYEKLEIIHRSFCLKREVFWWRKCRLFLGSGIPNVHRHIIISYGS